MQVLWHEALEGDYLITMDKFLYCYKPSKIKKSTGFYQFSFRGPHCSLIKGHNSSNRLWKTEFFIISGNWARDPVDVSNATFPPFTSPLGRLRPEGMSSFHSISFPILFYFSNFQSSNFFLYWYSCCLSTLGQGLLGSYWLGSRLLWEILPHPSDPWSSSHLGTWPSTHC